MDRLLARLELRFGRLAIPRLPFVFAVASAVVYALGMVRPSFIANLVMHPALVRAGQVWRLFTWLFIPPSSSPIFIIFAILFYLWIGNSLEAHWGSFKLNVYYLLGFLGSVAASYAFGIAMTPEYLHASLFFAFATLFPDTEILLFAIVPVRAKWLALITAAGLAFVAFKGDTEDRVAIGLALVNYFVFFGPTLLQLARGTGQVAAAERRRAAMRQAREEEEDERPARKCKICGLTDADRDADLRVCTCQEVCGGKATVYCLPHARSHNAKS